jgi:hypothetical protein
MKKRIVSEASELVPIAFLGSNGNVHAEQLDF